MGNKKPKHMVQIQEQPKEPKPPVIVRCPHCNANNPQIARVDVHREVYPGLNLVIFVCASCRGPLPIHLLPPHNRAKSNIVIASGSAKIS